ncbi:MAG: hypothetical protein ABI859_19905, partial [Pseudomonadota bacterium]
MKRRSLAMLGGLAFLAAHTLCSAAVGSGACHLLTNAEVAAAFPGAKPGVPETAREKYGILGCEWATPSGRVAAQFWKNESPTTARAEAEGMMIGALDPLKRSATKAVRYETLQGVGESAVVAIAKADPATGVLNDLAVAAVVSNGRTITIFAPQLSSAEPAKAIATLT